MAIPARTYAGRVAGPTRVEDVYRHIKAEVSTGVLKPGQRLNLNALAKALGVSLTVVREAAVRLSSERYLQATPQLGYTVWPLSVEHLLDLTRVRTAIESMTVRESVEHGDLGWESELVAVHHRLMNTPPVAEILEETLISAGDGGHVTMPSSAWLDAHSQFHTALAAACPSPILKELRQQLFDSAELYRQWSVQSPLGQKRGAGRKEHTELLHAALDRNAERVVGVLLVHIARTTDALLIGRSVEISETQMDEPIAPR